MTLEIALKAQLLTPPAITAKAGDRVFAVMMPEPEKGAKLLDSIVFVQSGRSDERAFGSSVMISKRFEVTAVSETYDGAHELADAIVEELNFWNTSTRGLFGNPSTGIDVQNINLEDQYDMTDDDFALGFFMVQSVFSISHR